MSMQNMLFGKNRAFTLLCMLVAGNLSGAAYSQGDTWDTHTPLPLNLIAVQATAVGDKLYVLGGGTSSGPTNALYVYDSLTDAWDFSKAPTPTVRSGCAAVELDGLLYLIGGCNNSDGNFPTDRVDVYDPVLDVWTNLTSMPTARCSVSAAAIGGKIYVVGGFSSGYVTRTTLDVYDPVTNTWLSSELGDVAEMPTPRESLGAVAIDGKLYVVGGYLRPDNVATNILEVYDPVSDTWSTSTVGDVTPMSLARLDFAYGAVAGKLYVAGGVLFPNPMTTDQLEAYDPLTDTWTTGSPMPTSRGFIRAGVIGNKLYMAGGVKDFYPNYTNELESYTPDIGPVDSDGDGVPDDDDAFPLDASEQSDNDQDGVGDNADLDDDNDGLSDEEESLLGTDPNAADSDGDGVDDSDDPFPLNSDVSTYEDFTLYLRDVLLDDEVILDSDLKNPNQRRPLQNKLTALIQIFRDIEDAPDAMTATLLILEAISKLEDDLIPKTDGFFGGNPNNDWVETLDGQSILYPELQVLLEALWGEI